MPNWTESEDLRSSSPHRICVTVLLALNVMLPSCTTRGSPSLEPNFGSGASGDPVHGRDYATLSPILRTRVDVHTRDNRDGVTETLFMEATVAWVDGSFGMGGGSTNIGGTDLTGALDVDFEMYETNLLFGIQGEPNDWASGHIVFGLGYQHIDLRGTTASGQSARDSWDDIGLAVGLGGELRAADWVRVYARVDATVMPAGTTNLHYEGGFAFDVSEHVDALVGYRTWQTNRHGSADLDLETRALILGFVLRF